jgi:hypothetical protein
MALPQARTQCPGKASIRILAPCRSMIRLRCLTLLKSDRTGTNSKKQCPEPLVSAKAQTNLQATIVNSMSSTTHHLMVGVSFTESAKITPTYSTYRHAASLEPSNPELARGIPVVPGIRFVSSFKFVILLMRAIALPHVRCNSFARHHSGAACSP